MTIKLNDTQLALLSAAAQREDRCLVASQHLRGGAEKKVADKLLGSGLVREIKAKREMPVWRRDADEGQSYALKLTAAGLKAIVVDEDASSEHEAPAVVRVVEASPPPRRPGRKPREEQQLGEPPVRENQTRSPASGGGERQALAAPRNGSKLATVIALLQRRQGATLEELVVATEWLPHTTRAALTGLRKRAYAVALDKSDKTRGSVYRIDSAVERQAA